MILSDKIIQLRKQMGWSQEELAEQLGVTRQSVSKWEVGAAVPDLEKILRMSQLFGVSTDFLLKDSKEMVEYSGDADVTGEKTVSAEEANSFLNLLADNVKSLALAVAVFIVSPICLLQLSGFSEAGKMSENVAVAIGMIVLMVLVAAGVAVCISYGMKLSKFEYLEKESFQLAYGVAGIVEKRKAEFEDTFRSRLVIGVTLIILAVIPLIVVSVMELSELLVVTCVNLLLALVAVAVYGFVWTGVIRSGFDQLLQQDDYKRENKKVENKLSPIYSVFWLLVTAGYLAVSFITGAWHKTWIIWPVAGVIFAAISEVLRAIINKEN